MDDADLGDVRDAFALAASRAAETGADVVQLFESWAGNLDETAFARWVIAPNRRIVELVRKEIPDAPIIGFPRGAGAMFTDFATLTGVSMLGLDATLPTRRADDMLPPGLGVQGNLDPAVLLASRLYPDMFPLAKQVQIASDVSKIGASRLAQVEWPRYEDTESSFPELIERLRKTIAFLETLKAEQIDGSETRTINWTAQGKDFSMPGAQYLFQRMLPNLFFHATTAYNILRHSGVEIGKQDFLGR